MESRQQFDEGFVHRQGAVTCRDSRVQESVQESAQRVTAPDAVYRTDVRSSRGTLNCSVRPGTGTSPNLEGTVASLARPGGNITGIANQADELLGKLIQLLHEVAPQSRRIAILLNESNPQGAALFRAAGERACAALGLMAIWVVASVSTELTGAVEQIVRQRAQAVVVVADPLYFSERFKLHALLQATGLPVACGHRENVVAGGLLGYTSNFAANFRYMAKFVDKILKGAKPADLPVEQPTKFELVINLKTAKALGIKIPQGVLLRADEVIQ